VRRTGGRTSLVDATQWYARLPGDEEQIRHVRGGGRRCTVITTHAGLLPRLWPRGCGLGMPEYRSGPEIDLDHRVLLAECRRGTAEQVIVKLAAALVSRLLASRAQSAPTAHRPGTGVATRRSVDAARELVAHLPSGAILESVARAANLSPHYLSRVFRESTGLTLSRYRNRVRVRLALEWLGEGEDDLSRIAHDLGFADHAHFSRTVMGEVGLQPRTLRRMLRPLPAPGDANEPASRLAPPCQTASAATG
jgi:AraC-like DNA-binding protein